MLSYFLISIIHSSVQRYLVKRDENDLLLFQEVLKQNQEKEAKDDTRKLTTEKERTISRRQ